MHLNDANEQRGARAAHGVTLLLGVWLLVGWAVLGHAYAERAVTTALIAGTVLIVLSIKQLLAGPAHWASVSLVWVGLALVAAPVVLRYGYTDRVDAAYANQIAIGLVVGAIGLWSARRTTPTTQRPRARGTDAAWRRAARER